jgi:drug/metabolite transporter (DMT)-like permease
MPDRGETRVERNRGSGIFGLLVGLSFVLGFPSAAKVQRFLGTPWLVVFSPGVLLALWVVLRYLTPRVLKRITARGALILAGLTVVFQGCSGPGATVTRR